MKLKNDEKRVLTPFGKLFLATVVATVLQLSVLYTMLLLRANIELQCTWWLLFVANTFVNVYMVHDEATKPFLEDEGVQDHPFLLFVGFAFVSLLTLLVGVMYWGLKDSTNNFENVRLFDVKKKRSDDDED